MDAMPGDVVEAPVEPERRHRVPRFIHDLRYDQLPPDVISLARRCLVDLVGVAAAGSRTDGGRIACEHAIRYMAGSSGNVARMLFDGRATSIAGAAFAGATVIDAVDAHDGHPLCKGHVGVAVVPSVLAFIDSASSNGFDCRELVASIVVGYEIGTRAGMALHGTVSDYHCSGAWNAIAAAAVGARLLRLDRHATREALGIAEYFGPRGQILRACNTPSMVKDGSGWGAHAGVSAALLARDGFTGAPAITLEDADVDEYWNDLGTRWRIREQYFKPYPVCRWAQPAVEAALSLQRHHSFDAQEIERITIESFREAVVLGAGCSAPETTEDAQYSLSWPVAAALAFGKLGPTEIEQPMLGDAMVGRLLRSMRLIEDPVLSSRFPAQRWARVRIELRDGRTLESEPAVARGSPENALTDSEIAEKYRSYALPVLGAGRAEAIAFMIDRLPEGDVAQLLDATLARA